MRVMLWVLGQLLDTKSEGNACKSWTERRKSLCHKGLGSWN